MLAQVYKPENTIVTEQLIKDAIKY